MAEKKSILKRQHTTDALLVAGLKAGQEGHSDATGSMFWKSRRLDGLGENIIFEYLPRQVIEQLVAASGGSVYWLDPVANFTSLPAVGVPTGGVALTLDTGRLYWWDGAAWQGLAGSGSGSGAFAGLKGGLPDSGPLYTEERPLRKTIKWGPAVSDFAQLEGFTLESIPSTRTADGVEWVLTAQRAGKFSVVVNTRLALTSGTYVDAVLELVKRDSLGNYDLGHPIATVPNVDWTGAWRDAVTWAAVVELEVGDHLFVGVSILAWGSGTSGLSWGDCSMAIMAADMAGAAEDRQVAADGSDTVPGTLVDKLVDSLGNPLSVVELGGTRKVQLPAGGSSLASVLEVSDWAGLVAALETDLPNKEIFSTLRTITSPASGALAHAVKGQNLLHFGLSLVGSFAWSPTWDTGLGGLRIPGAHNFNMASTGNLVVGVGSIQASRLLWITAATLTGSLQYERLYGGTAPTGAVRTRWQAGATLASNSSGLMAKVAGEADTYNARSIAVVPNKGLAVTNADGGAGNPTIEYTLGATIKDPTGWNTAQGDMQQLLDMYFDAAGGAGGIGRFTVSPAYGAVEYLFNAEVRSLAAPKFIDIPKTSKVWFIVINAANDLEISDSPQPEFFLRDNVYVATWTWSVDRTRVIRRGFEAHSCSMSWAVHQYLHTTRRTAWISGLEVVPTISGTDLAVSAGRIADEDIPWAIDALAGASLQCFYKLGLTAEWEANPSNYLGGVQVGAGGRPVWNNPNAGGAGVWGVTEVANNRRVCVHFWASLNKGGNDIAVLVGGADYATATEARAAAAAELNAIDVAGLAWAEYRPLATAIAKANASSWEWEEVDTATGAKVIDWRGISVGGIGSSFDPTILEAYQLNYDNRVTITDYTATGTERRNTGFAVDSMAASRTVVIDPDLFSTGHELAFAHWTTDSNLVTLDAGAGKAIDGGRYYILRNAMETVVLVKDGPGLWKVKASHVPNYIIAKGMLVTGGPNGQQVQLSVGTDGQVLTADAASAGGVKWATPSGGGGGNAFCLQFGRWWNNYLSNSIELPPGGPSSVGYDDGTLAPGCALKVPVACTIVAADFYAVQNAADFDLRIYKNGVDAGRLGLVTDTDHLFTGLSIALAAGDKIVPRTATPSLGGNAKGISVTLYLTT